MNGSSVMPKTAGIESTANITSLHPPPHPSNTHMHAAKAEESGRGQCGYSEDSCSFLDAAAA